MTTNQQTNQMSIREWIDALNDHPDDPRWLNDHENKLYEAVAAGIYTPHEINDAVELLNRVYPYYALERFHAARWSPLMSNAMIQAMDFRDNEMLIQIYTHLGESHLITGKSSAAHNAFQIALERALEGESQAAMLAAYTGLIRLQAMNLEEIYSPDIFENALELSRQVNDLALMAGLYQAMSLAYLTGREGNQALGYGETAYGYWLKLENKIELGKTAYLLAAIFRSAEKMTISETWLEIAAQHLEATPYDRQDILIAYERGSYFRDNGEYEIARQWTQIALQEAIQIGWTTYIALAYQLLGIIYGKQMLFTEAETSLKHALIHWNNVGDVYEQTAVHQAAGWLEIRRQDYVAAKHWLNEALVLCEHIPNEKQRNYMENLIRETLAEIP